MSIGDITPEYKTLHHRIWMGLVVWLAIGACIAAYFRITVNPGGTTLGVASSPERFLFFVREGFLVNLPIWLLIIHSNATNQEWLADLHGVPYEEGKRYPVFTTKTTVICALGIALFGLSGVVPAAVLDVPALVGVFLDVVYGPIIASIGVGFGFFLIRAPLFYGFFDPIRLLSVFFPDSCCDGSFSWTYWKFIRKMDARKKRLFAIVAYAGYWPIWCGFFWTYLRASIMLPYEAWVAELVRALTYFTFIGNGPNVIVAYLAGIAIEERLRKV